LKDIQAETVAEALVNMFTRVGVPKEILSDQGSHFLSAVMKETCRLLSLKQLVMRTSLNTSTARRHVPPSRLVTSQLRAALATQRTAQSFKFKMSVTKHQACFTTKLQGQNLATFSHSAVTPRAYLQHTNKSCVPSNL